MATNGDDTKLEDIVVDRSFIGCDNCGVGSPQKCCARCIAILTSGSILHSWQVG